MTYIITKTNKSSVIEEMNKRLQTEIELFSDACEIHATNDWNCGNDNGITRMTIAIIAAELGATTIDPDKHHGVLLNDWMTIALNTQKWSNRLKKWYPYSDLVNMINKYLLKK